MPYTVRIIGTELFGVISFAQVFIIYFTLIQNYGFEYTATRAIAANQSDKNSVQKIFSDVYSAKWVLFIFSSLVFVILSFYREDVRENAFLFYTTYLINIGHMFVPFWLFQGMGKIKVASIMNLIIKIIALPLILILIQSPDDYIYYNLSLSIAQVIAGGISYYYAYKLFKVRFSFSFKNVLNTLKDSFYYFSSLIVANLYSGTNIYLLGILSTSLFVGEFSEAYRIIMAALGVILLPGNNVFFPKISSVINSSLQEGHRLLIKSFSFLASISLLASISIYFLSDFIINLLYGEGHENSIYLLKIMSVIPIVSTLSNVFGIQGVLNLKKDKVYLAISIAGATLCLILNFILIPQKNALGATYSWISAEILMGISLMLVYFYYYRKMLVK